MNAEKGCPNCGIELPDIAASCPCGYNIDDDESGTPGPGSVRSAAASLERELAAGMMQPARQFSVSSKPERRKAAPLSAAAAPTPMRPAAGDSQPQPNHSLLMGCPSCSASISRRAPHCPRCGAAPFQYCVVCAQLIIAKAPSCPECGDPQPFVAPPA
jgi:hypothetical protein